jgi:hypothetical protein
MPKMGAVTAENLNHVINTEKKKHNKALTL